MANRAGRRIGLRGRRAGVIAAWLGVVCWSSALPSIAAAAAAAAVTGEQAPSRHGAHATKPAKPARPGATAKTSKAGKAAGKLRRAAKSAPPVEDPASTRLEGKLAFFHLRSQPSGQDLTALEVPVLRLLRDRGLTVLTELRPVDLPEQFRDLAAALDLIAYLDGTATDLRDDRVRVTLSVRSGTSGRKTASLSVVALPAEIPGKLDELFWKRLGPSLVRARADAQKPRRRTHAPLQIDAGSPLPSVPARKAEQATAEAKAPG